MTDDEPEERYVTRDELQRDFERLSLEDAEKILAEALARHRMMVSIGRATEEQAAFLAAAYAETCARLRPN